VSTTIPRHTYHRKIHNQTYYYKTDVLLQVILIVSGNLSFLNWLTILPSIFCLDDAFLSCLFSMDTKRRVVGIKRRNLQGHPWGELQTISVLIRYLLVARLLCTTSIRLDAGFVASIPQYSCSDELVLISSTDEHII